MPVKIEKEEMTCLNCGNKYKSSEDMAAHLKAGCHPIKKVLYHICSLQINFWVVIIILLAPTSKYKYILFGVVLILCIILQWAFRFKIENKRFKSLKKVKKK